MRILTFVMPAIAVLATLTLPILRAMDAEYARVEVASSARQRALIARMGIWQHQITESGKHQTDCRFCRTRRLVRPRP